MFLENHTPAQQVHDSGLPAGLYLILNWIPQQRGGHSFEMSHLPASSGGGQEEQLFFFLVCFGETVASLDSWLTFF